MIHLEEENAIIAVFLAVKILKLAGYDEI